MILLPPAEIFPIVIIYVSTRHNHPLQPHRVATRPLFPTKILISDTVGSPPETLRPPKSYIDTELCIIGFGRDDPPAPMSWILVVTAYAYYVVPHALSRARELHKPRPRTPSGAPPFAWRATTARSARP